MPPEQEQNVALSGKQILLAGLAYYSCEASLATYQDRPMYLIRAVTVHSNRPKEVWFGPSAYTARILWSGGKFFLIEGPQRPPPGLSGLHVVPPLLSPAAYVRPSPLPTPPLCAGACAPLGNAGM